MINLTLSSFNPGQQAAPAAVAAAVAATAPGPVGSPAPDAAGAADPADAGAVLPFAELLGQLAEAVATDAGMQPSAVEGDADGAQTGHAADEDANAAQPATTGVPPLLLAAMMAIAPPPAAAAQVAGAAASDLRVGASARPAPRGEAVLPAPLAGGQPAAGREAAPMDVVPAPLSGRAGAGPTPIASFVTDAALAPTARRATDAARVPVARLASDAAPAPASAPTAAAARPATPAPASPDARPATAPPAVADRAPDAGRDAGPEPTPRLEPANGARDGIAGAFAAQAPAAPQGSDRVALSGPPAAWRQDLHEALGERLNLQLGNRMEQAVIRLDPPQLGRIEIAIRHSEGSLQVTLSATHGEVLRQLHAVSDNLRADLAQRQYTEVAVTVAPAPRQAGAAPFGGDGQGEGRGRQPGHQHDDQAPGLALLDAGAPAPGFSMTGRE